MADNTNPVNFRIITHKTKIRTYSLKKCARCNYVFTIPQCSHSTTVKVIQISEASVRNFSPKLQTTSSVYMKFDNFADLVPNSRGPPEQYSSGICLYVELWIIYNITLTESIVWSQIQFKRLFLRVSMDE